MGWTEVVAMDSVSYMHVLVQYTCIGQQSECLQQE